MGKSGQWKEFLGNENGKGGYKAGLGVSIGEIAEETAVMAPAMLVKTAEEIFAIGSVAGIVINNHEQQPVGLLMKDKLYFQLGTSYGVSLYHSRPVERVMDRTPLVVEADAPVEMVSQLAMQREEDNLYDLIIVTHDGRYAGVVSIMHLLNHITNLKIRCAYNSNPLTGLPGNLVIEERMKSLIEKQAEFAVGYIDLDNFKAYNDKFGFERGDRILYLTGNILSRTVEEIGGELQFVGHVGGDDFVVIAHPDRVEKLGEAIIEKFDNEIQALYPPEDLARGYIEVINRKGMLEKFSIVAISIAVTSSRNRAYTNYLEVGEVLAELKKVAKQHPGSFMAVDRRMETDKRK